MRNDSPHITHLVQRSPLDLLRAFLTNESEALCSTIAWDDDPTAVRFALKQAILDLPHGERHTLDQLCERIDRMTDEAGVEAINYIRGEIIDIETFDTLSDQYARSLWLYLRERRNFHRAEDTRYADEYRGSGRIYSAFMGPKNIHIDVTEAGRKALTAAMAELFHTTDPILLDHFVRPRFDLENEEDVELHQFSIQHNGDQQSVETIQKDGDIGLIYFCPANSVKITYEPEDGVVEIFARDRNIRPLVCKHFITCVLDQDVEAETLPERDYDITSLTAERHFEIVDPEIASVRVTQLRLKVGNKRSSVTLKVGDRDHHTIYELAEILFGDNNPLPQAHHLDQAQIVIKFHRRAGQHRAKSLVIIITTPNGCNIKSHCDKDRQLADRYLRSWGLIKLNATDGHVEPERATETA